MPKRQDPNRKKPRAMPGASYAASTSTRRGAANARRDRSSARGATAKQKTSSR